MPRQLALLRGINVGGKNIIKMADLAACFERGGFTEVRTYIQSGNVTFSSAERARGKLVARLEAMLAAAFSYRASVVVRTQAELAAIVAGAPAGFGAAPARYRYDVMFLKEPLTAAAAVKLVSAKPGVDEVHAGRGVLYFSRLIARVSQSQINKIVGQPVYQQLTIRNWNTTTALLRLMEA